MDACTEDLGQCILELWENAATNLISIFSNLRENSQNNDASSVEELDWTLSNCCGADETMFCVLFVGFFLGNSFLWNTPLLKPMKLLAVFIHEMSHALACWLTCGEVVAINVFENEGGVTKYRGGCRCCIIPAGYVGCAFWGALFVALSGDRVASTCVASLMSFSLFISLFFAPNKVMIYLCLWFIFVTVGFILLEWFLFSPVLHFLTLYYGVSIGTFSVYDIKDDLIVRTVQVTHSLFPFKPSIYIH